MNDQDRIMNDQATVTRRDTMIGATMLAAASALGTEAALALSPASAQTKIPHAARSSGVQPRRPSGACRQSTTI
jgi:hypothetical protein